MNPAGNDWPWVAWTQVWQVTVLILAVALFLRCASRNRPQLAFVLWLVVFLKCIAPPLWSSPSGAFCWLQPPHTTLDKSFQGSLAVAVSPAGAAALSSRADSNRPLPDTGKQTREGRLDALRPAAWLMAVWIGGVVVMFGTIAWRWQRLARLVRQAGRRSDQRWDALLAGLASRLRLPWSVQLVATECAIGPAVLGLLRPTILLPQAVTDGKSADEIELVLAHELIHVRRGDLWFALLRSLVLSVWWFHPLVWWAGRRASREAERCCDEAVLAELRCSPARYARCLLDILEVKQQLSSAPAFPGVRAIEVTQGRLERIMKIGNGGCRRIPWWCWAVALLAAVAVLPGAALVISAGPRDAYAEPAGLPPADPAVAAFIAAGGGKAQSDMFCQTYCVKDLLSKIQKEHGLSEPAAKESLAQFVRLLMASAAGDQRKRPQPEQVLWLKGGDDLVIRATNAGHKRAADALDVLRKFGDSVQIAIETRFLTLGDKLFQEVLPESTMSPLTVDDAGLANSGAVQPAAFDRPLGSHEGAHVARAQVLIERDSPVRFRIVDKEQGEKLINRCLADERTNMLQAPKVTIFNGQTAFVSDTSQTPFVVGTVPVVGPYATAQTPQVRVVSEGTVLQLRPVTDRSGAVHLDFAATFSKIQAVDTATFNHAPPGGITIQLPKVATVRMEGGAALKPGQWLLLGGPDSASLPQAAKPKAAPVSWKDRLVGGWTHQEPRETRSLILMLRAEKVATDSQRADYNAEHGHP
jgi:beta-lactamase regulating signal transducer with metallopeptidase domain